MPPSPLDTLDSGLNWLSAALVRATKDRRSPFRWPVFCTRDGRGRTVVLRRVNAGSLNCHLFTDRRSPKVAALRDAPEAELVFFDPARMVQLRVRGEVRIISQGPTWQATLAGLSQNALSDYTQPAGPGRPRAVADDASEETVSAAETFTLLDLTPQVIDLLHLGRQGHRRAEYHRDGQTWQGAWLVP